MLMPSRMFKLLFSKYLKWMVTIKYLKGQNIKKGLNILDDAFFTSFAFCVINNDLLVKNSKD